MGKFQFRQCKASLARKCMAGFTLQRRRAGVHSIEKKLRNGIYFIILSNETYQFLYYLPQASLAAMTVKRKRRCNAGAFYYKLR
jgi:hypothetical protein